MAILEHAQESISHAAQHLHAATRGLSEATAEAQQIETLIGGGTDQSPAIKRHYGADRSQEEPVRNMRHARPAEQLTAARLSNDARFRGRTFHAPPPPDPGHDWVDDLGRTYDALGDGTKSRYFRLEQFTRSIDSHLLKSNDFTVVDMTDYTDEQILAVRRYVDALPAEKHRKIVRVGF